jgi:hypothetical protein
MKKTGYKHCQTKVGLQYLDVMAQWNLGLMEPGN